MWLLTFLGGLRRHVAADQARSRRARLSLADQGKGKLAALIAARRGLPGGLASFLTGGAGGAVFGPVLQHLLDALQKKDTPRPAPAPKVRSPKTPSNG